MTNEAATRKPLESPKYFLSDHKALLGCNRPIGHAWVDNNEER